MLINRKKIALYGGSFDPPHMGHQAIIRHLLYCKKFDQVRLILVFKHPFNKDLASFEHRFAMCELLCSPFGDRAVTDAIERELVTSGRSEGHTVDTLRTLVNCETPDEYTLVIGADIVHELGDWKDFEGIKTLAKVLILSRPGYTPVDGYTYAAVDPPKISSSELRKHIAAGDPVARFIYPPVLDYIRKTKLYM